MNKLVTVLLVAILLAVIWNPIIAPVGRAIGTFFRGGVAAVANDPAFEPAPAATTQSEVASLATAAPAATDVPAAINADGPIFGTDVAEVMTDSEMYLVMQANGLPKGVKLVATKAPWEPAKWSWQANDKAYTSFTLVAPWQATVSFPDGTIKVYIGTKAGVAILNAEGFTLRQMTAYDPNDRIRASEQSLLVFEDEFGHLPERGDATYFTCKGNLAAEYTSTEWADACK